MDVLELIDELRGLVHGAKHVPLRDQVRVDKEKLYGLLDRMRSTIPEEIKEARWIVREREEMLAEAKREAERIVEEARGRQSQLVAEHQLIRQAERAAQDIIDDTRVREREIRLGAEDYAAEILDTLEVNLSKFVAAVQRGRERLQRPDEPGVRVMLGQVWARASPWRADREAGAFACRSEPQRRADPAHPCAAGIDGLDEFSMPCR
jgi:hypothetical protein